MSPEIQKAFRQILNREQFLGPVLEVGASPGADSLLHLLPPAAQPGRTAINLEVPQRDTSGIRWVRGNANRMTMFEDASFGCVVCNSVLEHDPRFWESVREMRRVTRPGGLMVLGVPGFRDGGPDTLAPAGTWARWLLRWVSRLPAHEFLRAGTLTLSEHFHPGDYYRFSEQAMREILLDGLDTPQTRWLMVPPRVVGWGRKSLKPD